MCLEEIIYDRRLWWIVDSYIHEAVAVTYKESDATCIYLLVDDYHVCCTLTEKHLVFPLWLVILIHRYSQPDSYKSSQCPTCEDVWLHNEIVPFTVYLTTVDHYVSCHWL